jgi:ABC-type polysaccharide/polyol phosphate transport system ATPase subunit
MASLVLDRVTIEFPIYGAHPTLRSLLVSSQAGGAIVRRGRTNRRITVRALENISLTLHDGDRVGLIGHNGAGKSTLLRVMAGVYEPVTGSIRIGGNVSPLFNVSPGLDHEDTGYENIVTCGLFLGMSRAEIAEKTPDIAAFSELGEYLDLPVRTYSTGMITRLGFAIATALDPEILLLDEGLGAGDARFADRAKRRIDSLVERSSILVLASHDDTLIQSLCSKAVLMDGGRVIEFGPLDMVLDLYHRRTAAAAAGQPMPHPETVGP